MQIYELTKPKLTEAGFLSRAYNFTKDFAKKYAAQKSRNYLARVSGLDPADFKSAKEIEDEKTQKELAARAELNKQQTSAAMANPTVDPEDMAKYNIPAYKRKGQSEPAATTPVATPTAAAEPATSAMSSMASQLAARPTKSSTGGTVTPTATGIIHTAKPATTPKAPVVKAPVVKAPVAKAPMKKSQPAPNIKSKPVKVSAPPKPGAPTSAEYANLERRLQQAMKSNKGIKK